MQNQPNRRRVLVDEDVLRQLIAQVQSQGQQALVPNQGTVPAEYQIFDHNLPRENQTGLNPGDNAVEIDLNRDRNKILRETWG